MTVGSSRSTTRTSPFRYSDNLAAGDGPVWNVGEDPVEGFTNFLWMVWHAPFALDLPLVAKLTSFAAGAYVVFVPTYFHVTGGLETIAFAALLPRAVIGGLRAINGQPIRAWEPPLLLVLAGMLRPEGVLAALPAFAAWLWTVRRDRKTWAWTAGAAVLGGAHFVAGGAMGSGSLSGRGRSSSPSAAGSCSPGQDPREPRRSAVRQAPHR